MSDPVRDFAIRAFLLPSSPCLPPVASSKAEASRAFRRPK